MKDHALFEVKIITIEPKHFFSETIGSISSKFGKHKASQGELNPRFYKQGPFIKKVMIFFTLQFNVMI